MSKYLTHNELVELLKNRGMLVDDDTILKEVNYSHIIYKYAKHYWDEKNGKYLPNTRISQVYELYKINLSISTFLFEFITLFEHRLRVAVVEEISSLAPLSYLNINTYKVNDNNGIIDTKRTMIISDFIFKLSKIEENKRHKFDNSKLYNGKTPLWLLVDELSLGTLRMFAKLTGKQNAIANRMSIDKHKWSKIIESIHEFRNLVHHSNPLTKLIIKTNDKKVYLSEIYLFLKGSLQYKENWIKIENRIDQIDKEKCGFTKEELLEKFI